MVSVSEASDLLLSDARTTLQRTLTHRPQASSAVAFAYWMLKREADAREATEIAEASARKAGAQLDFQTVATLGFASQSGVSGAEALAPLRQGLERLAGRTPIVDGIPMGFCSDAVGILGVTLGCKSLGDAALSSQINRWLCSFLTLIYNLDGTENWQRHLFQAADLVLNGKTALPTTALEQAQDARVALSSRDVLPRTDGEAGEQEEARALRLIMHQSMHETSFERAALKLAALEHVIRTAPTVVPSRISPQELVRLLERIPAALRKWTWEISPRTKSAQPRQWHMDHEYHVQNLLWALLAPIFPDLDDEQYLTKIGHKNPRADFYIPSMKLVIEAKFLRPGDRMQKIIDEISSDTGLYSAMGNDCSGIIPVVWDDGARSHEHDYLRQGLRKLPNIVDAIILSRPSGWTGGQSESKPKTKAKRLKQAS